MNTTKSPVTLIGLGPMGQAMGRTLLSDGHPVTVWNRTPSRAEPLVAEGARPAASAAAAVASSELTILSLTDYQAMYDILSTAESALEGRTIVNLSSDDPDVTRRAADWAAERGAGFVAGGVMVPAPMVGTEAAYVYYSGQKAVFAVNEPALRPIGEPRYLGQDPGLAQLFYLANLDVFLTTLSSLLHASALAASAGVKASRILPELLQTVAGAEAMISAGEDTATMIDSGVHPGDLANAAMMGATADHIVSASKAAGIDLALPQAVQSHYHRAIAAGHGKDSWTALFEIIKKAGQ